MNSSDGLEAVIRLFAPRSVAIIGASRNPRSFSGIMADRLQARAGEVALHLVNPHVDTVRGQPAVASLADVDDHVDAALVVLPAAASLDGLRQCVEKGVPGVVLFAALPDGYAEFNEEVRRLVAGTRTRVLGPNCLGLANLTNGISLTYGHLPEQSEGPSGGAVAIIGHSGAVLQGIAMHAAEFGTAVGYLVSLGNESDLSFADFAEYFCAQPRLRSVVAYLEQIRDPQGFRAVADRLRAAGKQLIVLRAGASETARELAGSHTGAIVGAIEHEAAFLADLGVHMVTSTHEAVVVASAVRAVPARLGGLAVLATSGGFATIIADLAAAAGVGLPRLDAEVRAELSAALASTGVVNPDVTNPLDLGVAGADNRELFKRSVRLLLGQDSVAALLFLTTGARVDAAEFAVGEGARVGKPVVLLTYLRDAAGLRSLAQRGVPVFGSEDEAVTAVAALLRAATPAALTAQRPVEGAGPPRRLPADRPLVEDELKEWLAEAGIAVPRAIRVHSLDAARAALARLNGPIVLKVADPRVVHKTEAGGVEIGIADAAALAGAWTTMRERLARAGFADPAGFLVEEQVNWSGPEWLVGVRNDFGFGPLVVFGLGGVLAEAMPPPVTVPAPLTTARAIRMLADYAPWRLFVRRSGMVEADAQLAQFLVTMSVLAQANRDELQELDLNPVVISAPGPIALDAALVRRR